MYNKMKLKEHLPQDVIGMIYEYDNTYRRQYDIVVQQLERFLWWREAVYEMFRNDAIVDDNGCGDDDDDDDVMYDLLIGDAIVYKNELMYP